MYEYTEDIINSIIYSFCTKVLTEFDLDDEFFASGYNNEVDFIKDKKVVTAEILDNYFESGEADDDLTCGNAEYWLELYDILDIENEMLGNEYEIAHERMRKIFAL